MKSGTGAHQARDSARIQILYGINKQLRVSGCTAQTQLTTIGLVCRI